jgi:CMP-N-acetylneuraminic acid synthetase
MPEERSLDIDTIKDFVQAKKKLKSRFSKFK